jgi:predicted nucleotidyltransferase component of viral defense system
MFKQALSKQTFRALTILGESQLMSGAYLAGGTALALRLGHRLSIDLDFFTDKHFDEKLRVKKIEQLGKFKQQDLDKETILGNFMKVKFSCFYYSYPLLDKLDSFEGIRVAGFKDLAAMKMQAIGDRGTKRDFIDLYWLRNMFSLEEVLQFYDEKFGKLEERKYHLFRALRYFEDADGDALPQMLKSVDWIDVKRFFVKEVRRLSQEWQIV